MTTFPTTLDTYDNPTEFNNLNDEVVPHADQHANINDAMEAVQAKIGIDGSGDTDSLDYKVTALEGIGATSGAGSPEGVVSGNKGRLYWNETDDSIWMKRTNGGNTDWWKILG